MTEATPAEWGPNGSAAPARFESDQRTHSLMDLELERNPPLRQLLKERDGDWRDA